MTLIELKEQIDELIECGSDPQMEVVMTADYGDIGRTIQALPIRLVEERTTEESAYSKSGIALADHNDDDSAYGADGEDNEADSSKVVMALLWGRKGGK